MQRYYGEFRDKEGRGYPGAVVTVYLAGTSTKATIFHPDGPTITTQQLPNPFTTDSLGNYAFAAANGDYDIHVQASGVPTRVFANVSLMYPSNLNVLGNLNVPGDETVGGDATVYGSSSVSGDLAIGGDAGVTGNATVGSIDNLGALDVAGDSTLEGDLVLKTAPDTKGFYIKDPSGNKRWVIFTDGAESGSDAGSDLTIGSYKDDGSFNDFPMKIIRAAGGITYILRDVSLNNHALSGVTNLNGESILLPSTLAGDTGASYVGHKQSYTGSVRRTLASRADEWISVKDFGALGDGTTDDTAAIQAALNASNAIYFPRGVYKITSSIAKIADGISLVGQGDVMILCAGGQFKIGNHAVDGSGYFTTTSPINKNLDIYGLTFQADAVDLRSVFVSIVGYQAVFVAHCRFLDFKVEGLYLGCGNKDISITNCYFDGNGSTSESKGLTLLHYCPDYQSGSPISPLSFTQVEATPATYTSNFAVSGCAFNKTRIQLSNVRQGAISGCVFGNIAVRGINCSPWIYDVVVAGCLFDLSSTASTGINCSQLAQGITITGNEFIGALGAARCVNVYYISSAHISGNHFRSSCNYNITVCVNSNATIRGNTFNNAYLSGTDILVSSKDSYNGDATHGSTATSASSNSFAVIEGNSFLVPKARVVLIKGEQATSNGNALAMSGTVVGRNVVYNYSASRASGGDAIVRIESNKGSVSDITLLMQTLSRSNTTVAEISATYGYYQSITNGGSIAFRYVEMNRATFRVDYATGVPTVTRIAGPQEIALAVTNSADDVVMTARCAASVAKALPDFSRDASTLGVGYAHIINYTGANPVFRFYDYAGVQKAMSSATGTFYVDVEYQALG